jgi:hypothetical protein
MPGVDKIGEWDSTTLVKFIQDILQNNPSLFSPSMTVDQLSVAAKAIIQDQIQYARSSRTTVGSAGSASALPANPTGYIEILDYTGQVKLIPYYNAP